VVRVLAVCLGNICRSPAAEAAIRAAAEEAGIDVEVDSAATGAYHVGEPPNARMRRAAAEVGLRVDGTARQVQPEDFHRFDLIVAMDRDNLAALRRIAPSDAPAELRLLREFDPAADDLDVPDPYYGTDDDYRRVLAMIRPAAEGLVAHLATRR